MTLISDPTMSEQPTKTIKLRNLSKPKSQQNPNPARNENEKLLAPSLKQKVLQKRDKSQPVIQQNPITPSIPESFKEAYSDVRNSPSFSADIKRIADKITSFRYKSWSHRCSRHHRTKPY